jgi:hypothetical protein
LVSDLGGEDAISSAEHALVRRASMLTLQLELLERKWATENEGGVAGPKALRSTLHPTAHGDTGAVAPRNWRNERRCR